MIDTKDQEYLFKLIADYLKSDIECIAIGGTAMMFYGYKTTTKDIDLVFKNNIDRKTFIGAIEELGYKQSSLKFIYNKKILNNKNKPLIYTRGDERFDLFVKDVFGFEIDFKKFSQRHDFIGKKELIILTALKEDILILKSVTNRDKDYEDIETIAKIEKDLNWNYILNEAIKKSVNHPWILIDLEEKMQKLKNVIFIKKEYFDKIYKKSLNDLR
jgi:hypothetical protein